jgi:hypothetical protein
MRQLSAEERERIVRRLQWLAWAMDTAFVVPGTNWRFGWDPVIGTMPVAGDIVGLLVSAYIILEAARLGASRWTLIRMIVNVLIDAGLGAVPVVGDIFDAAWKANVMNLRLMGIATLPPPIGRKFVPNIAVE